MSDRDEYLKRLRDELGVIDKEIDELEITLKNARGREPENPLEESMDEIKKHYDRVAKQLSEANESGSEAWHEARKGLDHAWEDLKAAFRKARSRLGD